MCYHSSSSTSSGSSHTKTLITWLGKWAVHCELHVLLQQSPLNWVQHLALQSCATNGPVFLVLCSACTARALAVLHSTRHLEMVGGVLKGLGSCCCLCPWEGPGSCPLPVPWAPCRQQYHTGAECRLLCTHSCKGGTVISMDMFGQPTTRISIAASFIWLSFFHKELSQMMDAVI